MNRLLLAACLWFASPAWATLSVGVGTDFPISAGGYAVLELPARLRISTSVGLLPKPYLNALTGVLVAVDALEPEDADLIGSSLQNALVWRTHLGFRPFGGFFITGGYTLVTLGGGAAASGTIAAVMGETATGSPVTLNIHSTIHQLGGELGYRFGLSRLSVELALGGFGTFTSSTRLSVDGQASPLLTVLLRRGENYLDNALRSYVHGGYVSVRVFFELF